jgi:hypothetical protein
MDDPCAGSRETYEGAGLPSAFTPANKNMLCPPCSALTTSPGFTRTARDKRKWSNDVTARAHTSTYMHTHA